MDIVTLSDEKGLVGRDLNRVYAHFHSSSASAPTAPLARFKRKEPIESMAKSILKHRIQTLTGANMADVEHQLGFSIKAGVGISVEQVRRLAHLLILESNGILGDPPVAIVDMDIDVNPPANPRKRTFAQEATLPPPPATETNQPQKRQRISRKSTIGIVREEPAPIGRPVRGRKSMAPQMMTTSVACNLKPEVRTPSKLEAVKELTLDNPTPQMIEQKRKSMSVAKARGVVAASKVVPPERKVGFTGASFVNREGRAELSKIYLVHTDATKVELKSMRRSVPEFPGCHLACLHTPAHWQPPEVFNMVQSIRQLNKEAGLLSFLVLVGCGISNVHMFREALFRQTRHVQFVVFERNDQNASKPDDGKLRDTTSYFLLAYFFPGCQEADSQLPDKMVRAEATTCFQTKSIEDLENSIIHNLSEEGDWLLDICCKSRELSLAAQKSGRFAVAVDEEVEKLSVLKEKAAAISRHYDKSFGNEDGTILKI